MKNRKQKSLDYEAKYSEIPRDMNERLAWMCDKFNVSTAKMDEIIEKKYSLAAGQYFDVKIEHVEITEEEFNEKMGEYASNLQKYFDEGNELQKEIMEQLGKVRLEK